MSEKSEKWHAVSVTVTPDYVEAAESAFNCFETLGLEVDLLTKNLSGLCSVIAYFTEPPEADAIKKAMEEAAEVFGLAPEIDFAIRGSVVEQQDWLAEWKKHWKPTRIGRFVIAAPWHDVEEKDALIIRIEPNMAFGTGTHETTQLCLAAIDRHYRPGQSFLDVGTGTGILAIAAALVADDSTRIAGVDTDEDAVRIARENSELNGIGDRIEFSAGSLDDGSELFDFVCANLTADVIIPLLGTLIKKTGAVLVLSGILGEQEASVLKTLPHSLEPEVARAGEWISITVRSNL